MHCSPWLEAGNVKGKQMNERARSFSSRTMTGPGEAREVMTMSPRYLLALCLVLILTACATYSGDGYYYPYSNYTYPYNNNYPYYYSPYYYNPHGYYYTPTAIRPRVHPGHGGGGHGHGGGGGHGGHR